MENPKQYTCELCDNKLFCSSKSFSNHKRIHHTEQKDNKRSKNDEDELYHCRYCEKKYTMCNSRWRHEKTCSLKHSTDKL